MKAIGKVNIINAEKRKSAKSGREYFYCVAMSDENLPCVFFASVEDNPEIGTEYMQYLTYDTRLSASVRYEKAKK